MDVCCCAGARELPPPGQSEGLLLRFFRKVYVPLLLHRVTRVVVVSGAGGSACPQGPRARPCAGWLGRHRPRSRVPPLPPAPPQLLLFTGLFGAGLYLMCQASVGLDQELALPKVSCAL